MKMSLYDWCVQNDRIDILDKWDYGRNQDIDIHDISCGSKSIYVYIKCKNTNYHGSYKTTPDSIRRGYGCPYCSHNLIHTKDSFGQWAIDNVDKDFLSKYWGEQNTLDPFSIGQYTNKYIYIKCQNHKHHGEYKLFAYDFRMDVRCPYCAGRKTLREDSIGVKYPNLQNLISDKSKIDIYSTSIGSNKDIWLKCHNHIHKDYKSPVYRAVDRNFECPKCHSGEDKSYLHKKVEQYIKESYAYNINTEYDCNLVTINPLTGYILPYDIEVIIDGKVSLYIEVQGKQHFDICLLTKDDAKERNCTPEEALANLQYRDRIKKENVLKNKQHYLEIPYWTEKDESYKTLIDNKIHEISTFTQQNN
nr:MAG TPA: endonuclease [Caudoviricetes sp.]